MHKLSEVTVTLERDGHHTPWGIRLVGGSDLDTPLIITKVQVGSPAQGELYRGDVITKIEDYDSRDLRHDDANYLFKNAGNTIKLVVQRDPKAVPSKNTSSRPASTIPSMHALSPIPPLNLPFSSSSSPVPGYNHHNQRPQTPQLPTTVFPPTNGNLNPYEDEDQYYPEAPPLNVPVLTVTGPSSSSHYGGASNGAGACFSPQPTRDAYQMEPDEETAAVLNQPYRTTPLILPGAKVKNQNAPTESYLRHHPNPHMRAHPMHYDFQDHAMKQRVADSVLHRVVGDDPNKVIRKQFNTPIGLYSESNIEKAIHQTVPYKNTRVFDPMKSETFRAIQEDNMGYVDNRVHEVPQPVQTKVFHPNKMRPNQRYPPHHHHTNAMGVDTDDINQSGSFKRLMHSVLGESEY